MVYAKIRMYNSNTTDNFDPQHLFLKRDNYIKYILQIHLVMGRDFPPADETGAADPFIIAKCMGQTAKSQTKFQTLNPGFFEVIEMEVSLPPNLPDVSYLRFLIQKIVPETLHQLACIR